MLRKAWTAWHHDTIYGVLSLLLFVQEDSASCTDYLLMEDGFLLLLEG